jgi:hypothetical protein
MRSQIVRLTLVLVVAAGAGCRGMGDDAGGTAPRQRSIDELAGSYRGVALGDSGSAAVRAFGTPVSTTSPAYPIGVRFSDRGPLLQRNPAGYDTRPGLLRYEDVAILSTPTPAGIHSIVVDDPRPATQKGVGIADPLAGRGQARLSEPPVRGRPEHLRIAFPAARLGQPRRGPLHLVRQRPDPRYRALVDADGVAPRRSFGDGTRCQVGCRRSGRAGHLAVLAGAKWDAGAPSVPPLGGDRQRQVRGRSARTARSIGSDRRRQLAGPRRPRAPVRPTLTWRCRPTPSDLGHTDRMQVQLARAATAN